MQLFKKSIENFVSLLLHHPLIIKEYQKYLSLVQGASRKNWIALLLSLFCVVILLPDLAEICPFSSQQPIKTFFKQWNSSSNILYRIHFFWSWTGIISNCRIFLSWLLNKSCHSTCINQNKYCQKVFKSAKSSTVVCLENIYIHRPPDLKSGKFPVWISKKNFHRFLGIVVVHINRHILYHILKGPKKSNTFWVSIYVLGLIFFS